MTSFWTYTNSITNLTSVHARLVDAGQFTLVLLAISLFFLLWEVLVVGAQLGSIRPTTLLEEQEIHARIIGDVENAYKKFCREVEQGLRFGYILAIYLLLWHSTLTSRWAIAFFFLMAVVWSAAAGIVEGLLRALRSIAVFLLLFPTGMFWACVHGIRLWLDRSRLSIMHDRSFLRFKQLFTKDRSRVRRVQW